MPTLAILTVAGAPALACFALGVALVRRRRYWGIRLIVLSLALVNVLGGACVLASLALANVGAPATLVGWFVLGVGVFLLVILRAAWPVPRSWQGRE